VPKVGRVKGILLSQKAILILTKPKN